MIWRWFPVDRIYMRYISLRVLTEEILTAVMIYAADSVGVVDKPHLVGVTRFTDQVAFTVIEESRYIVLIGASDNCSATGAVVCKRTPLLFIYF